MEISAYILSDKTVKINRLHICTWDMRGLKSFVEVGADFSIDSGLDKVSFVFAAPFISKNLVLRDVYDALTEPYNIQFIFNDKVKSLTRVDDDVQIGKDIAFDCQNEIRFLPIVDAKCSNDYVTFSINHPTVNHSNYFRFLVETDLDYIATIQRGISKSAHIYDVRVNELRNIPNRIYDLKLRGYQICHAITNCYVMHVVPSIYSVSHTEASFRCLRVLENDKFYAYLPGKNKFKEGEYVIAFNKQKVENGSCSVCTEFENERIGDQQILFALTLNLLCSLLFALGALFVNTEVSPWYAKIPIVYYVALIILCGLIFYEVFVYFRKK